MGKKIKIAAEEPTKVHYDCSKCPGYCCSYPRIEVKPSDVKRLAKYFNVSVEVAERRFTRVYMDDGKPERILRHQKDTVYKTICRFFDTEERRCTIYEGRPAVCRDYPNGKTCGYYTFLKFERKHQDDKTFVPLA
jgi:Fe-S-cluster containining protein